MGVIMKHLVVCPLVSIDANVCTVYLLRDVLKKVQLNYGLIP